MAALSKNDRAMLGVSDIRGYVMAALTKEIGDGSSIMPIFMSATKEGYFVSAGLSGPYITASTVLPVLFLGGVQLLSIGVLGEYVGKIYSSVQGRPRWIEWQRLDDATRAGERTRRRA